MATQFQSSTGSVASSSGSPDSDPDEPAGTMPAPAAAPAAPRRKGAAAPAANLPRQQAPAAAPGPGLQPHPPGVRYDADLEQLCRVAASVGGQQPQPVSYTALIIALLFGQDEVSRWLQQYVGQQRGIDAAAIYRSKKIDPSEQGRHLARAASAPLPQADPLYSRSVRNLMEQAARIARDVAPVELSQPLIAPRHLMAAYTWRNPSDHVDQVRGWGFDGAHWQEQFLAFAQQRYPDEQWSRLKDPAPSFGQAVSSFTADDPQAPALDLLGVEDEAAAFARLAAARAITPPLAIGVFGEWGSGKTFFMRRIFENVQLLQGRAPQPGREPLFHADIVQIRFNAWHYIETNLWASLVEYIFAELDRWLLAKAQNNTRARSDLVFDRLATAQQLKLEALEEVVARRSERHSAEQRAERARREYEEALARSNTIGAGTYGRALVETFLQQAGVADDLKAAGQALGIPTLVQSSGRVVELLDQARSEAGRARLVMRAGIAKLGTWPWMASAIVVLVALPLLAAGLKDQVAVLVGLPAIRAVHETVLAAGTLIAALVAWGGTLVRRASGVLTRLDAFSQALSAQVARQVGQAQGGEAATHKTTAEEELRQRQQALVAAERALADADMRLNQARQDFESTTARSRLNAFIRAKATDGDYARHLGVIAAIRRDFGQLAALMSEANDSAAQKAESRRLAEQAGERVNAFLAWLEREPEIRLARAELRSLLSLLEPAAALALLERQRALLAAHAEGGAADVEQIRAELAQAGAAEMPRLSRIILYIDDLDRCPPETVVKVLQAVHLLLCFPLFTVVVAVDARWVSRALKQQFPNLLAEPALFDGGAGNGAGASSHDYLEKIFQIPYWVRSMDATVSSAYVNTLVDADVRRVAGTAGVEQADRTGSAEAVPGPEPRDARAPGIASARTAGAVPEDKDRALPLKPAPEPSATGLELSRWEADALQRFAPMVGATPRRLIRFVNVYRLIKTSLPQAQLERFVGGHGESLAYRALIVQLAIVTGAPEASMPFFQALAACEAGRPLRELEAALQQDEPFMRAADHPVARRILAAACDWPGTALNAGHLAQTAPLARRYSFTARPH
jgi:hypothetical protein